MKTIIFDLGGVLLDWNPHRLYAPYFNSSTKIDQFFKRKPGRYFNPAWP